LELSKKEPFMKKIAGLYLLLLLVFSILVSCGATEIQEFTQIEDRFFEDYFQLNPIHASEVGEHSYDSLLTDVSSNGIEARKKLYLNALREIRGINTQKLPRHRQIDQEIFLQTLHTRLFLSDTLREQIWNPILHIRMAESAVMNIADKRFTGDSTRAMLLMQRFRLLPGWLSDRVLQLENPSPAYLRAAIAEARQSADLLADSSFVTYFPTLSDTMQFQLLAAAQNASNGFASYANRLENDLLPDANAEFRLGEEVYTDAFRSILRTSWTQSNIQERAEERIAQVKDSMYAVAADLAEEWWDFRYYRPSDYQKNRTIDRVISRISSDREVPENIHSFMSSEKVQLENFVENRDLITLNQNKQLMLRALPLFLNDPNGIHLNNPGPLDNNLPSYLDLPLTDDTTLVETVVLDPEKFNTLQLQILSIHEAIPGKFVQHYYSNRYPSLIRTIYPNITLINGWAHYAERMMIENGWAMDNPPLKLTQQKREIATALAATLAYQVHVENLSESAAIEMLMDDGFQTRSEAEDLWLQIQLNPFTLSAAFVGKELIIETRENFRQRRGTDYELIEFHKLLLSFGSPPIHYLNNLLLQATF